MQYDVIVLGATFAAAGIVQKCKERCLVLERRPQVGYEFFSSLNYGKNYDADVCSSEAKELKDAFCNREAFMEDRVCISDCASLVYRMFQNSPILLNMEIISVNKETDGYTVIAHGVSGYRKFKANKLIDTRVREDMILSKTFNVMVNGEIEKLSEIFGDIAMEKWGYQKDAVLKIPVSVDADYISARKAVLNLTPKMPDDIKILMSADDFDFKIKQGYPKCEDGVLYLPSAMYENPLLAFDAGVMCANGGMI